MSNQKKTKRKKRLTVGEKRKLISEVRKHLGNDISDDEICEKLELKPHLLSEYKKQIVEIDKAFFEGLDAVSAYSDYILKMRQIIKELQYAITICMKKGQGQALVSAIWRKKEVFDSILKWGQEFGFVPKKSSELKLSSELSFSTMTDQEVEEEVQREIAKMNDLINANTIIRPEVAAFIGDSVKEKIPSNIVVFPKKEKKRAKKKAKVKLTLRNKV